MASPLREVFARFGVEIDTKPLDRLNSSVNATSQNLRLHGQRIGKTTEQWRDYIKRTEEVEKARKKNLEPIFVSAWKWERQLKLLQRATTAFVVAPALAALASYSVATARALDSAARSVGLTTRQIQELQFVAERSGLTLQQMTGFVDELRSSAQKASEKTGDQRKAFASLGVAFRDQSGRLRNSRDMLADVGTALSRIEDPARRAKIANDLFGASASDMLPMLDRIPTLLASSSSELDRLGGGISSASINSMLQLGNAFQDLITSARALAVQATVGLMPVAMRLLRLVTSLASAFSRAAQNSNIMRVAMTLLTAAMVKFIYNTLKANPLILRQVIMWGLYAAAVAIVVLAIEDIYTTITGGRSVLRELIDGLFGIGTTKELIDGVVDDFRIWAHWIEQAATYMSDLADTWGSILGLESKGVGQRGAGTLEAPAPGERSARGARALAPGEEVETFRGIARGIASNRVTSRPSGVVTPAARSQSVSVGGSVVNVHVATAAMDPEEVGRIARRETALEMSRQRRQTLNALTPSRAQ